jgi:signal transduction histidine kinase
VKKRLLNIIIALIIISLLGITGLQYFWINNAYHIKEAQFDRGVRDAMQRVVSQLETREKVVFLSKEFINDTIDAIMKTMKATKQRPDQRAATAEELHEFERMRDEGLIPPPPPPPPTEFEFQIQYNGSEEVVVLTNPIIQRPEDYELERYLHNQQAIRMNDANHMVFDPSGRPVSPGRMESTIRKMTENTDKLRNMVQKMKVEIEELSKPIEERIDLPTLKDLLKSGFAEKGIGVPFEFAIVSPFDSAKMVPIKSQFFTPGGLNSPYRVTLFPNDVFQKPHYLIVFFHGEKTHILKSFAWILTTSLFFTIVIIVTSIMSIFFMIRQKKISDIKTDFINNMTHEFKTPIATISIAADSINNAKVIEEPGRIRDYTKIIKEENQRMNTRVEQVLQMALIDSKDFQLRPAEFDAHELIRRAAEHFRLIIARRDGILNLNLEAEHSVIMADADHFRNVVLNLLDNANKYSPSQPEITVTTFNRSEKLFIAIEDKGMGMNPETRRKVFDKFYRFSTGNIHNIKGFGLGLSYVKAIVLAHKGEIFVQSEVGKGSRFEISIPVVENGNTTGNEEQNG